MSRSLKAHLLLISITIIWGSTFVVIKHALLDVSPLFFNAVRMSLAAITLVLVFQRELTRMSGSSVAYGALVGTFLWMGNELQTYGLKYTTPSKSAFLTGVSVVLVPVFLALFWKRGISLWSALGVGMTCMGFYLLAVPVTGNDGSRLQSINYGDLITLLAAVVFAFHIIYMGHATQAHSWKQIVMVQTGVAAVLMILAAPLAERVHVIWSGRVISGILITGFLSLALAFAIQAWAQQFTPPTHTALIFSLEPVFAWVTAFVFLGERLGGRGGLGALLILGGVLISEEKGAFESIAVAPDHAGVPPSPTPPEKWQMAGKQAQNP